MKSRNKERFDLESVKRSNLVIKSALFAIFLFTFLFGFNAAGMLKNLSHQGAYVSPLFTLSHQESKPIGLLRKMHATEPSFTSNYSRLFVGEVR